MGVPLLAKSSQTPAAPTVVDTPHEDREARDDDIRCPLCSWRPSPGSRWCCSCSGTPEPFFEGCGTVWNTFSTRGRCPGCQHQWQWTTCLSCGVASRHDAWYRRGRAA
jgi:hypothetical protein